MGPLAIAGMAAAGTAANAISQGTQNRKSRKWSEKMYERQRQDNLEFWHMQNQFNDPAQQRARMEAAGLNPALMYGGSGSVSPAANLGSPDTPRPEFNPAMIGSGLQEFAQIYDLELKQAQTSNVKALANLNNEKTIMEQIRQVGEGYKNHILHIDAHNKEELGELSLQHMRQTINKLKADTAYTLDQNERAAAMFAPNLQNAVEDILTKRLGREVTGQTLYNLGLDGQIKELDARLSRLGIRPNDPFYAHFVGNVIGHFTQKFGGVEGLIKRIIQVMK